jgi:hypothetical protein
MMALAIRPSLNCEEYINGRERRLRGGRVDVMCCCRGWAGCGVSASVAL